MIFVPELSSFFILFSRYSVILQIFQKHAQTREAKLQVRLAEIPYLKARLFSDLDLENESKHSKQRRGREWFDKQRLALNKREKSIKSDLDKGRVISEGIVFTLVKKLA